MKLKRITDTADQPSSPLPVDFLKMVTDVFQSNFDKGLKVAKTVVKDPALKLSGDIYPDEIRLTATVAYGDQISATSFHASADYDPQASKPTAEEVLGECVDALGSLFGEFFLQGNKKRIKSVFEESIAAMDNIPYEWSELKTNKRSVFLKVDKSNPELDQMGTDWLSKNDPKNKVAQDDAEGEELLKERLEKTQEKN